MAKLESLNYGAAEDLRQLLGVSDIDPSACVSQLSGLRGDQAWLDRVSQMWVNEAICTRGLCVRGRRLAQERPFSPTERRLNFLMCDWLAFNVSLIYFEQLSGLK